MSESMMSDGEDSFTAENLYQCTDKVLNIKVIEETDEGGRGKQCETMANRDISYSEDADETIEEDSSTCDKRSREKKEREKDVKVRNNINIEFDNDDVSIDQCGIIPNIIQNSASSWKLLEQFVVNFGKRNSSTLNVEV